MTDIDRELHALYRRARSQEAPSPAERLAVRTAVASALVLGTGVATAHAAAGGVAAAQAAKALTLGKIAAWLCMGAALGGVTSSATLVLTSSPEPRASLSAPSVAPSSKSGERTNAHARLPAIASAESSLPDAPAEAAPGASPAPGVPPAAREHATSPATPELAPPSLVSESEGLQSIQQALSKGDAPRALKMLGEQDAHFRSGALAEERAAVRVLAWCAAGQPQQARAARDRFLTTYPRSPHAKRVLNSCAKQ